MSYITTAERIGHAEGLQAGRAEGRAEGRTEGLVEGIGAMLDLKFGSAGTALMSEIQEITDIATLERLLLTIKTAVTPEDVRAAYTPDV